MQNKKRVSWNDSGTVSAKWNVVRSSNWSSATVDYEALYDQGVAEGIIPSADVSLETWVEANENEYKQVYQD
ncbi:hypothetical protein FZ060_07540, partial [Listeria monocytogenes]